MTSTPCSPIPEPVANARLCRHEARACRLRLHFPPQVADVDAQKVDFAVVPFAPDLPQKLLVLHQFMQRMIVGRELVDTADPAVQVLIHADGQGSQGGKAGTWANLHENAPAGVVWGWKNFIDEDHPMATPEQTYQVQPTPHFVSYQ